MINTQYMNALQGARKGNEHVKVINNTTVAGDDYYIQPFETLIFVNNDSTYTQDLYLPRVGESVGMTLTIIVPDVGGGGTIYDNDDSLVTWADLTMNADSEYAVIHNTGQGWVTLITDM